MKSYREAFREVKRAYECQQNDEPALCCDEGFYRGCAVLTLQKRSWRNGGMRREPDETGIFFSVWIDAQDAEENRANYNIHALKLRQLKGYQITSRDFATAFRAAFDRLSKKWPNVSVAYGPQTLMQGWIEIDMRRFARDVLALLERFEDVAPIIDELLAQRVASKTRSGPTTV
jgi:hypothetical protein